MRFTPDLLDDIRARLPVSEVVGRRVKLKKAGREWKGLSPFNKERTPSFTVNDQKGFYKDFSSGKSGDIFKFVMETEGLTFPEAVERLAGMAGVSLPVETPQAAAREQRRKSLYEVLELAAKFFSATLAGRRGAHARGYLADRALDAATQLQFRLGYAPAERFALKEHLGAQGIPVEDMIEAGLVIAGDDIPVPYDRFRDRVMFPITDTRGRVIAFGGRALQKDAQAKYLNSPETPLFHKGETLYNIAAARTAAHQGAPVIVVEGYVDVIAMVSAGYSATVAPLGTALTENQLALLWKMADEPVLCLDGDAAGRRAAYRVVDIALAQVKAGKSLRFALLPQGQDPDDLVRSAGPQAVAEVVGGAMPLADMLWTRETEAGGFDTPERRAALEARLAASVQGIGDQVVRRYYQEDMTRRVRALFSTAFSPRKNASGSGKAQPRAGFRNGGKSDWKSAGPRRNWMDRFDVGATPIASAQLAQSAMVRGFHSAIPPREALILRTVLNHPWLLHDHAEELAELDFRHPDADRLCRAILDAAAGHPSPDSGLLAEALQASGFAPILARIDSTLTHKADWPARPEASQDDVSRWWDHVITLHRKHGTLHRELKEAERALGHDPSDENFRWIKDLQERLAALEGAEAVLEDFGASSGRPPRGF
ncbi:MAG: primase [Variibacter sp.]|jgi:DNA primase|nr:primase [Variibacter sp.]